MARIALAAVFVVLSGSAGVAADRVVKGKLFAVKGGASETGRRVVGLGKESATDVPAISDPRGGGATLTVVANGGTPSNGTYLLDAAGWSAVAMGFRYSGPTGADGDPVERVIAKRTPGGRAQIKIVLRGNVGTQPLDVEPPNPGTEGGFILDVAGGDRYCVKLGGAAGGVTRHDTATYWKIVDAQAEDGCPSPPTTSTTTSTTTTTLVPVCGNGVVEAGEQCDGAAHRPTAFLCDPSIGGQCFPPGSPSECQCCGTSFCGAFPGAGACCPGFDEDEIVAGGGCACAPCGAGEICSVVLSFTPFHTLKRLDCCKGTTCGKFVFVSPNLLQACCYDLGLGPCVSDDDCCEGVCEPTSHTCCLPAGASCSTPAACCSGSCNGGTSLCD